MVRLFTFDSAEHLLEQKCFIIIKSCLVIAAMKYQIIY